jgi:hypothetical protein
MLPVLCKNKIRWSRLLFFFTISFLVEFPSELEQIRGRIVSLVKAVVLLYLRIVKSR